MLIEAIGLCKSFGEHQVVRDVSFTIAHKSIVGLLGSNGAGKSTTMRIMAGTLRPDSGTIQIAGHDIVKHRLCAQSYLGYLPEAASGFSNITTMEFLIFAANSRGFFGQEQKIAIENIVGRLDLLSIMNTALGTLSKGWRQRVWLAQAMIHNPSVLILDEPTDGLDPNQKVALRKLLHEIAQTTAIIMSTHILEEAENLCDHVIVMNQGNIVADLPKADLLDDSGHLSTAILRLTAANDKHG